MSKTPKVSETSATVLVRSKFTRAVGVVLVIGLIFGGLFIYDSHSQKKCDLKIQSTCYNLEYARTSAEQAKGLGGRDSLPQDNAMLFVFKQPGYQYFWMKDTHFALDIIWLNSQKQIVGIEKSVQPDTYPDKFVSKQPAQYVLEFNAGEADKHSLQMGQQLKF